MAFRTAVCPCLDAVVREIRSMEQTQELRVTDDLPDIGKILGTWGQVIVRSKEWRSDSVLLSGGVQMSVLYTPEDGTRPRGMETWIPFQMKWELPEGTEEGRFCVQPLLRFAEARSVSPRKMLLRIGIAALGEGYVPTERSYSQPQGAPDKVELLIRRHTLRVAREAGEKTFQLEEDLPAPEGQPEKILYGALHPDCSDAKVLANKIAFRGSGNLHVLAEGEDGALISEDYPLAFSQFAELESSFGPEAQAELRLCVTDLELEPGSEGQLHLKCGILAQFVISDQTILETAEDAYSPGKSLELERSSLELPVVLEKRSQLLTGEQSLPGTGTQLADVSFLMDFPRQYREEDRILLEAPGSVQLLYYGEDGKLHSAASRWEGRMELPAADARLIARPGEPGPIQVSFGTGNISLRTDVPVSVTTLAGDGIPLISGIRPGQEQEPDPGRPSLILRRPGELSLWELAKASGSTMEAIRQANGLTEDPRPDQMLLIPVI